MCLIAAMGIRMCAGFGYAWSVLQNPIITRFGWAGSSVALACTITVLCSTIAIGGQTNQYMPDRLIQCVIDSEARHLTVYSLIKTGAVDRMITTHAGTDPLTNTRIQKGFLQVELALMSSFIERLGCGGMGLGGVLTRTGIGTLAAEGKQVIEVTGQSYLLAGLLAVVLAIALY